MRNPKTLAFLAAVAAAGLYAVGLLWLVPTSPYNEWLLLVTGLLIAGHWMLSPRAGSCYVGRAHDGG